VGVRRESIPALTSHSELSGDALREAGISLTTIRIAVGDEDPRGLLAHLMQGGIPGGVPVAVAEAQIDTTMNKFWNMRWNG
jgi:hypothetical protein